MNRNLDVFGYTKAENGFTILKNGEPFLQCTGSEDAAKQIVELLQKDGEK